MSAESESPTRFTLGMSDQLAALERRLAELENPSKHVLGRRGRAFLKAKIAGGISAGLVTCQNGFDADQLVDGALKAAEAILRGCGL